jgi:phospholipid-binding lipoprotein MlaA
LLNNSTVPGDILIAGSQIDTQGGGILLMRFIINTTIGLFGIFDIADELGIKSIDKRFSDTLAIYGFPSGDYIVLPLLGPSSIRGAFDLPTIELNANFWNPEVLPLSYANFSQNGFYTIQTNKPIFGASLFPFKAFNVRIDILPITDDLDSNSVDLYYAYRDMYLQYDKYKREQRLEFIKRGYFAKTNSRAMNLNELSKFKDNDSNLSAEVFSR